MAGFDVHATRKPRRWLRRFLLLAASLTAGAVLLEGSFRFVLFADAAKKTALAQRFRKAELFATRYKSREYWQFYTLFSGPGTKRAHSCFDWRFGWTTNDFDPETLAHEDEELLGDRTPVLLFGDSFAHCLKRAKVCWEDLLEDSPLSERYALLNYGVGGYGLDQAYVLMHHVLPRFRDRKPIVIMGVLVGDDLDRSYLPMRRVPKPSFLVRDGELVLQPVQHATPRDFLAANPVDVTSWFWRYLLFGTKLFPRDVALALSPERGHVEEKEAVNRAIIAAVQREIGEAGLDGFFFLLHSAHELESPRPFGWQEPFLYRTFEELSIPFVSSKRYLQAHLRNSGTELEELFFDEGGNAGHYNELGNTVAFPALLDGLEGRFEPYDYLAER